MIKIAYDNAHYDFELSFLDENHTITTLGSLRMEYQFPVYRHSAILYVDNPDHQSLLENDGLLTVKYISTNATLSNKIVLSYIASGGPLTGFSKIYAAALPYFQNDKTQIRYDADIDGYVLWAENVSPPLGWGSSQTTYPNIVYDPSFEDNSHWYNLNRDTDKSTDGVYSAFITS